MAKKIRSAKQKANDRRLGKMAKSRTVKSKSSKKTIYKIQKVRTMARRKRSRKSKSSGFSFNKLAPLLAPIAYGFVRERASDLLAGIPALQKLPATQFTDEGVMLAAIWGLKKLGVGKRGIGSSLLRAGKTIELARVGQTFADMQGAKSTNRGGQGLAYENY